MLLRTCVSINTQAMLMQWKPNGAVLCIIITAGLGLKIVAIKLELKRLFTFPLRWRLHAYS